MTPSPSGKKVDFVEATCRHFDDAAVLDQVPRRENAGHLYGLASECALKAVMVGLNPALAESDGDLKKKERFHLNKHVVVDLATGTDTRLGNLIISRIPNITAFKDWEVEHRYYSSSNIPPSFNRWKTAALEVRAMLDWARTSGLIT